MRPRLRSRLRWRLRLRRVPLRSSSSSKRPGAPASLVALRALVALSGRGRLTIPLTVALLAVALLPVALLPVALLTVALLAVALLAVILLAVTPLLAIVALPVTLLLPVVLPVALRPVAALGALDPVDGRLGELDALRKARLLARLTGVASLTVSGRAARATLLRSRPALRSVVLTRVAVRSRLALGAPLGVVVGGGRGVRARGRPRTARARPVRLLPVRLLLGCCPSGAARPTAPPARWPDARARSPQRRRAPMPGRRSHRTAAP